MTAAADLPFTANAHAGSPGVGTWSGIVRPEGVGPTRTGCYRPPSAKHRWNLKISSGSPPQRASWDAMRKARPIGHEPISCSSIVTTGKEPQDRHAGLRFGALQRGAMAPASGWFARAERILEDAHLDSVVRGYLLIASAISGSCRETLP